MSVLWRLIIVCVVCLYPTKRTLIILGLNGLASEFTQQAQTSGCHIIIDVVSTSMRCHGVASTLIRRCFNAICLIGYFLIGYNLGTFMPSILTLQGCESTLILRLNTVYKLHKTACSDHPHVSDFGKQISITT